LAQSYSKRSKGGFAAACRAIKISASGRQRYDWPGPLSGGTRHWQQFEKVCISD
jgi:hypothetical protein